MVKGKVGERDLEINAISVAISNASFDIEAVWLDSPEELFSLHHVGASVGEMDQTHKALFPILLVEVRPFSWQDVRVHVALEEPLVPTTFLSFSRASSTTSSTTRHCLYLSVFLLLSCVLCL